MNPVIRRNIIEPIIARGSAANTISGGANDPGGSGHVMPPPGAVLYRWQACSDKNTGKVAKDDVGVAGVHKLHEGQKVRLMQQEKFTEGVK